MRKSSPLLKELFEKYFKLHVSQHVSRPRDVRRGFELHWGALANKRADSIELLDVKEWIVDVAEKSGPHTANRQFNNLRACLNWGVDNKLVRFADGHPCEGVKKMPVEDREVYLKPNEEFFRLKAILDAEQTDAHDAIWMLLLTAARKSNVLGMQWKDIDMQSRVWIVPAKESKNRKPLRLPITEYAFAILERRAIALKHRTPWVFPSPENFDFHLVNIDYRWRQIREEAQLGDLHIHDLRHTAASWMGSNGASAFHIQRVLGHSTSRMTERYVQLELHGIRDEMERSQAFAFR